MLGKKGKDGIVGEMSYYNDMLKEGLEYQDFIFDLLYKLGLPLISYSSKMYQINKGENKSGIEIKYDKKFSKTGNFWIEFLEKSNVNNEKWIKSGIDRDDNTWLYLMGDYEVIYVFSKRHLKMHKERLKKNGSRPMYNNMNTSVGFLLSKRQADFMAVRIIKKGEDF